MNIAVYFKNGQITERFNDVLAIVREEPDMDFVLLHGDGSETIYLSANVESITTF